MARIDRQRLEAAAFPITLEVPTRFDDLDVQGHVNNAAGVVILQEARVGFNRAAGLPRLAAGLRAMVAAMTVEFAGEIGHPDPVSVSTGLLAVGRTSFTMGQVARQGGRACLFSEVVMVIADAHGPTPLPDALREGFGRLMIA